jgi:glycosyltransferase involved in cell wall biosynthesis
MRSPQNHDRAATPPHDANARSQSNGAQYQRGAARTLAGSALPRAAAPYPFAPQPLPTLLNYPIIVHSHLRWDWVWQRPQQFLSRFAQRHRVLFCEGPTVHDEQGGDARFEPFYTLRREPKFANVTVMQTHFPAARFHEAQWVDAERRRLLCRALETELQGRYERAVQWFYDPMAAPIFIDALCEIAVVYDCMDQLCQFKNAPPELCAREKVLLQAADVVFTGGRKMWEDKSRFNPNTHFYGCGVDVAHFGAAREASTPLPADIVDKRGKVLGYFGVVDERLDYELIARLADADPAWNVCVIGPACKVDPADFPQRPNLCWMGGREYSQLPAYAKAFDVCLMPFALNEATEYINPTKALEYMATGTPIVSSAVPDVVSNFSEVVAVADSHDEFIAACRRALEAPNTERLQQGLQMAAANTWEAIVAKMEKHIEHALMLRTITRPRSAVEALLDSATASAVATARPVQTPAAAAL